VIEVRGLVKTFGVVRALDGVDLDVARGEVVCVIGPSGSGKSTLLRCVNALERPGAGTVRVDGLEVRADDAEIDLHRAETGMVFQAFNLFPHLTALENVTLAPRVVRRPAGGPSARSAHEREVGERGRELLARVGIGDKADEYPARLSGGQQQRVAIARALAMEPKAMLFDEPTSALDVEMIGEVLGVMRDLAREGMTMLVATHELGFAREVAQRIAIMDEGRVLEEGPPAEILERPRTDRARDFLCRVLA
jgi:ABC-type polar amino acid transport system ATPase subunit